MKIATITAAAAKITRPECATPPTIASYASRSIPVLLRGGEQEDGVVHRDREDHREEEHGSEASTKPCDSKPRKSNTGPFLEDEARDAEGGGGREQVREHADGRDQGRLQREQGSSRKPSTSTTPTTSGVRDDSASSRSWFSAAAPPTRLPVGSASRRRSIVSPTAGSDGSAWGVAWSSVRVADLPATATPATPASPRRTRAAAVASSRGTTTWAPPGASPERLLHEVVAAAGQVALGHDLDRRHARLEPKRGQGEHDEEGGGCSSPRRPGGARAVQPSARTPVTGARPHVPTAGRAGRPSRAELREHGRQEREGRGEHEDDRA